MQQFAGTGDGFAGQFSGEVFGQNVFGFSGITNVGAVPTSVGDGLRRMPFVGSALISSEGCGSITATRFASRPCASQPDSIAPPILPAPARTMVPLMSCKALVVGEAVTTNYLVVPANAGTHNPWRF